MELGLKKTRKDAVSRKMCYTMGCNRFWSFICAVSQKYIVKLIWNSSEIKLLLYILFQPIMSDRKMSLMGQKTTSFLASYLFALAPFRTHIQQGQHFHEVALYIICSTKSKMRHHKQFCSIVNTGAIFRRGDFLSTELNLIKKDYWNWKLEFAL